MKKLLLAAMLIALLPLLTAAQPASRDAVEEARARLQTVESLYAGGDYEGCLEALDTYFEQQRTGAFGFPQKTLARLYGLRALVAYAFRGEGEEYRQEIRDYLLKGLELYPDLELGRPSEIPSLVYVIFTDLRQEYLDRFSRTRRRWNLGLLGAVVIDPTILNNPSLLQPGMFFAYNLTESFSLTADLRLPLAVPIWGSIRGQAGLSWYPAWQVRKISTSVGASYQFSLDNLTTYTHSLSLTAQAEIIARSGIGFGMRAELLRTDLILGLANASDLPQYNAISLFSESFLRIAFANTNFFIFYTF